MEILDKLIPNMKINKLILFHSVKRRPSKKDHIYIYLEEGLGITEAIWASLQLGGKHHGDPVSILYVVDPVQHEPRCS